MKIEGAIIKEQGQTFAIVIVKRYVINSNSECDRFRKSIASAFRGMPIILMAQNSRGVPTYQGRSDIVKFLASIDHRRIPWRKYTIT